MKQTSKHIKRTLLKAFVGLVACAGLSAAQDIDVRGDGSNGSIVMQGKNLNPNNIDIVGVEGYSAPAGNWGIGVKGMGGYRGVEGRVDGGLTSNSGVGDRAGIYGAAYNGGNNYGVRGFATGSVGTNYGVWGSAVGTNSRAGYFSGDLEYTGALVHNSDQKLKKNITLLHNCLGLVGRLAPKEFDYRTDEFPRLNLPKTRQMGLVAQDVEAVLPDLVKESIMQSSIGDAKVTAVATAAAKPESYKTVDYMALIPVLIGAVQEQQAEIDALKKQLGR